MGIPVLAPTSFFAGDTSKWLVHQPAYLPPTWSAKADITNASNHYTVTGSDNGDGRHLLNISPAVSAAMVAGDYTLRVSVTDGTDQFTIHTGALTVRPNLSGIADARSQVKQDLDALNAWITSGDPKVAEYWIAGRKMRYQDPIALEKLRAIRKKEYRAEQNADLIMSGRKPRRRLLTRMA